MQFDAHDFCTVTGLVMMGVGLWLIYPPAALVILGIIFFLAGKREAVK